MTSIDRRRFLTLGGATVAATALWTAVPAVAQAAPTTSVNG
ncbi:hypothetical protein [Actinophytocola oryzae]|uniref:Uncharacterized protein n=1 Tax=Actinophytocola oryzae TaxID=502181 RepID=A0A4R7UQ55_9PSEU|nr:hypothetical protein [Actinophytocola oryzae]TDV36085.1 hypothetical protein CLV71_13263 [Actinophytocola oryzae]